MPPIDRRLELKEKTSMAQNAWQAFVYANGLNKVLSFIWDARLLEVMSRNWMHS